MCKVIRTMPQQGGASRSHGSLVVSTSLMKGLDTRHPGVHRANVICASELQVCLNGRSRKFEGELRVPGRRDSRRSHLIGTPLAQLPASLSASTASVVAMMTTMQTTQRPCTAQRCSFAGSSLRLPAAAPPRQQLRRAAVAAEKTAEKAEKKTEKWSAPALDPSWPSPIFGGSTGGLLRKAQVCGPTLALPADRPVESQHRLLQPGAVLDAIFLVFAALPRSVAAVRCERVAMPDQGDLTAAVLHVDSMCPMPICIPSPSCPSTIWMTLGCEVLRSWLLRGPRAALPSLYCMRL